MPANLLSYLCCTPEGAHAGFADVDTATALSLPSPDLGAPPLRLFLLTHVEDAAVCSTLNKEWATQWRQEMNTNLASLSDLNKSQRDGVAKAVMQTCSLWQVSLHFSHVRSHPTSWPLVLSLLNGASPSLHLGT